MPKVYNKRTDKNIPSDAVYVGRPTDFGNPFPLVSEKLRNVCIAKYEDWLLTQPELIKRIKAELKNKDLICFCSPKPCHADILLRIANL